MICLLGCLLALICLHERIIIWRLKGTWIEQV
jgi:hypothetical protein